MTTAQDIRGWWDRRPSDTSHMMVVCDTFDHDDYPVYVKQGTDVRKTYDQYNGPNMQKVMEVYSASVDFESQMLERRAVHFD